MSNELQRKVCASFVQVGQDEVLRPYLDRYLEMAQQVSDKTGDWADRSHALSQNALTLLFPRVLPGAELLERVDAFLTEANLTDAVRRVVSERRDDVARSVRAQETGGSAG